MKSSSFEQAIQAQFDCLTKKVIKRAALKYKRGISRRLQHEVANYVQTECQFRYCGTAIPFLTVRSTAR